MGKGLSGILVPKCRDLLSRGILVAGLSHRFPGPDCLVALSPGLFPNPGDSQDQDRDPVESRDNRPSLLIGAEVIA